MIASVPLKKLSSVACVIVAIFCSDVAHTQVVTQPYRVDGFVEFPRVYYNLHIRNIDYCGEEVPLERVDVREDLERDFLINVNDRTQIAMYIKRAGRFFPYVEKRLRKEGLPDDLKYIMVIESGMLNVSSPARASGFWQIIPSLAREYGLEVSKVVDERYNFHRATTLAIAFLKRGYAKFGSWTLAAAAYNMGMSGLYRAVKKQGKRDYYKIWLNRETRRYVFRVLAIKHIFENLEKFGYGHVIPYKPLAVKRIKISRPIKNLAEWARKRGISYKLLRRFNPWIRRPYLRSPRNNRGWYAISVPMTSRIKGVR